MIEYLRRILNLPFMPHGMCYLWQPSVLWLHVISDAMIAVAYMTIPGALFYLARKRRDVPYQGMFIGFSVFIAACGATHAMEVWNVWHANYLLAGAVKAVTAIASVPTAFLLLKIVPQAVALPSPAQMRKSEARFRMAAKAGHMFAYEWDVATDVIEHSGEFASILGVNESARITGQEVLSKVYPDDLEYLMEAMRKVSPEHPDLRITYRMIRPDGKILWVERNSRAEFDAKKNILRLTGMVADVTERKQFEQKLHKISHQLIRAQDTQRRNIARDLHESAGQTLAALKMTLGNANHATENGEDCREELRAARNLAEDAIREVRVISYLMHPPLLDDAGLRPALEWYAKGFAQRSGIEVTLDVSKNFGRYSQEIETTIFRIVQEALTNIYRHSGSRVAAISLARENHLIRVQVEDQGRGLSSQISSAENENPILGVGIEGMRERVKQMEGTFEIESNPGRGARVRVILPAMECSSAPEAKQWNVSSS